MSDSADNAILSPGDVLNNTYVISELIAAGGTGEVYRAMNRVSGREIAVKILKREFAQNEQFTDLMKREASVLHEVIDPAVVRYYDVLESDLYDDGFLFIVMEFINGQSVADEMKEKGPLPADMLLKVAERVLQGLKAAHDKKAFHRDLSPDNIILRDGDPEHATLIDFGIAKDVNEGAKTVVGGGFAGKYQYASPEQMEGRADARSDLYSLGMTLLGAFRGQSPLAGSSLAQIVKAKAEKPDISDMTGTLHDLVNRLVEPLAEHRFQTAEEALRFLAGEAATPVPPAISAASAAAVADKTVVPARNSGQAKADAAKLAAVREKPKKSRAGLWLVLLLLLLGGGGGGAYFAGLIPGIAPPPPTVITEADPNVVVEPGDGPAVPEVPADTGVAPEVPPTGDDTAEPVRPEPVEQTDVAELPLANPFRLSVERTAIDAPLRLIGNLPAPEAVPSVSRALEEGLNAFAVIADVTPAQGEPFDGWTDAVVATALVFRAVDAFTVAAEGSDIVLIAQAQSEVEKSALLAAARSAVSGTQLAVIDRIEVTTPEVNLSDLSEGLRPLETCGPFTLSGGAGGTVPAEGTITISGYIAAAAEASRISAFFAQNAPGRSVVSDVRVLNTGVCNVLTELPSESSQALAFTYAYGQKDTPVPGDTFRLGENPVIEVELPADRDGYLHVAFVDLAEQVFHLLPHQARTQNTIQTIGNVAGDTRKVRVTFPVSEASIQQLGFNVVEPLGINIVLAVVTDEPLFPDLRPRAESNGAFLEALDGRLARVEADGGLVTWRFLLTEP
ncbi:MAG: protein kinase [Pseudomonadota bacterium]